MGRSRLGLYPMLALSSILGQGLQTSQLCAQQLELLEQTQFNQRKMLISILRQICVMRCNGGASCFEDWVSTNHHS
jgi:hypothetical protein